MHVNNYELTFLTEYDDGYTAGNGGTFTRTIAASDFRLAFHIAWAMLGEQVGDDLWLSEILMPVRWVCRPANLRAMLENREVWLRVLKKLQLKLGRVRFIYSDNIGLRHNLREVMDGPSKKTIGPLEVIGLEMYYGPRSHPQDEYGPWRYYEADSK